MLVCLFFIGGQTTGPIFLKFSLHIAGTLTWSIGYFFFSTTPFLTPTFLYYVTLPHGFKNWLWNNFTICEPIFKIPFTYDKGPPFFFFGILKTDGGWRCRSQNWLWNNFTICESILKIPFASDKGSQKIFFWNLK